MQKLNQRCPFNSPDDFYTYYTSTSEWRKLSKNRWVARTDTISVYHYFICEKLSSNLFFVDCAANQKQRWECLCLKSTFVLMSSFQIQVYLKWVCIHIYVWISSAVSSLALMQSWRFGTTEATAGPQRSLSWVRIRKCSIQQTLSLLSPPCLFLLHLNGEGHLLSTAWAHNTYLLRSRLLSREYKSVSPADSHAERHSFLWQLWNLKVIYFFFLM